MVNYGRRLIKYLFVPCQANNYHPRTIQKGTICFYIFFLFAFQLGYRKIGGVHRQILGFATEITVEGILDHTNQERIKNNLPVLDYSEELSYAAEGKAKDMFEKNYWAHISPTGVTPWQFINNSGYNYVYAGENLAKDFNFSQDVVSAWLNSPSHQANILNPKYTDIGIAVVNGNLLGRDTTLVVQEFGKEATASLDKTSVPIASMIRQSVNQQEENIFATEDKQTAFNFRLSRTTSLLLSELFLVVLFIDSIYVWRKKIIRLTGNSIAHFIFIVMVIAAIGFTSAGVIL